MRSCLTWKRQARLARAGAERGIVAAHVSTAARTDPRQRAAAMVVPEVTRARPRKMT